jgi:hypothetical protein
MVVGFQEANVPFFNLALLNDAVASITHVLDPAGVFVLPVSVPPFTSYGGFTVLFQAGYLDAAAPFGISATPGLRVHID